MNRVLNRDAKGRFCKANPESKSKIPKLTVKARNNDRVKKAKEEIEEPMFVHIRFNPDAIQNVSIFDSIVELLRCIVGD